MNVNKININQSEPTYYIASDIYDVSYHNNNATFESLSTLLNDSNLSTLIPSAIRCGGMTIRFVQSSDNRYVQYRLMSDEFTTDTTQWAIDDESVYIENLEFISIKTDAEGKLLWWIESDGSVNWSKGVPTPIQIKLQELEKKIKDESYDDKPLSDRVTANEADIVAINDALNNYKAEVTEAISKKVDGETLDNYKVEVAEALDKKIDGEYIDNPEFLTVKTDSEGKLLWWIEKDGTVGWSKGVPTPIQVKLQELEEKIKDDSYDDKPLTERVTAIEADIVAINDSLDNIPENLYEIEDIEERISINMDKNDKIISFRDASGKLNECVGLKTPAVEAETVEAGSLNLSQVGLNEFEQALRNNGFRGGQGDWSEATSLHIQEPRCAMINITSADGKPYSWPTSKFVNNKVWVEFYDMQGNYFKKRAIHNAQGNSSMGFIKKNGAFDFCNDEWIGDDTFSIKFGDWVYQDSFHAKAYYTDFFKGVSIVAYKIADQVEKSRGIFSDRPWKKALLKDYVFGSNQSNSAQINDMTL